MTPSAEQLAAIESDAHSILVSAGPGSGKTATTVRRIVRDMERGVDPAKMVAITFTRAGAFELRERVAAALGGTVPGFVGTLHSFALESLPYMASTGFKRGIKVLDEAVADALLQEIAKRNRVKASTIELRANVLQAAPSKRTPAGIVAIAYRKALKQMNAADYDTILAEFLAGLGTTGSPMPSAVYVDEFQDSALIDLDIYRQLWKDSRRWVVGDMNQSIYTYRGARPDNMRELMESKGWTKFALRDNYRSRPGIVEAANRLIAHNPASGSPSVAIRPRLEHSLGVLEYDSAPLEAQGIAAAVKVAIGRPQTTVAVLCRYNAQVGPLVDALTFAGVNVVKAPDERERAKMEKWRAVAAFFGDVENYAANVSFVIASGLWKDLRLLGEPRLLTDVKALLGSLGINHDMEPGEILHRMGWSAEDTLNFRNHWAGTWQATAAAIEAAIDPPQGEVHVGTMHSAKGKEWDWVFLTGAEHETTPKNKEGEEREEERRLFYVAATRAREILDVSWSHLIKDGWKPALIHAKRSQFVAEMGL